MKQFKIFVTAAFLLLLVASLVTAHPHFRKTVTASLSQESEATLTFYTVPSNETHTTNAAAGAFLRPGNAVLKLSAEMKAGSVTLAAGEYALGVVKNSADDWTMVLYPGQIGRGEQPDKAKLIKLESMYAKAAMKADHLTLDITPGHGKFEGRAAVTIHFGTLYLAGAIS